MLLKEKEIESDKGVMVDKVFMEGFMEEMIFEQGLECVQGVVVFFEDKGIVCIEVRRLECFWYV